MSDLSVYGAHVSVQNKDANVGHQAFCPCQDSERQFSPHGSQDSEDTAAEQHEAAGFGHRAGGEVGLS